MARNNTPITVRVPAARYADHDDCLEAAAEDYAAEHDLEGWDLSPRWADDQRDEILLSVPAGLAPVEVYLDTANGPVVEYGDHDEEAVEAAVPAGWRVDWETPAYQLASGRWRAPLVRLVGRNDAINKDPPWHRHQWSGAVQAIDDGVDLTDPWPEPARYGEVPSNVARIVECGATNCDDWDGTCYGVVELSDGRFVAWESWWDATGSGFSEDAYGGDADFGIAKTEESARGFISAKTRQSCASADRT